jgi:hypothetical protein
MHPERDSDGVPHPIRYALLEHASDEANLWELPWSLSVSQVEVHPRRTMEEVRPWLVELLSDGHLGMWLESDGHVVALDLDEALAAIAEDENWDPKSAHGVYLLHTTESGDAEFRIERTAAGS